MNYTEHLNLPQWEGSDPIHHDDFNEAFESIDTAIAGGVKIATGSYTGTGECGAEHPNTLTFDFVPQLVIVSEASGNSYQIIVSRGVTQYCNDLGNNTNYGRLVLTWGEHSLSWYCTSSSSYGPVGGQMNTQGVTYHYVAIGAAE